jgi:uncharacterized lipoprotein YmbA
MIRTDRPSAATRPACPGSQHARRARTHAWQAATVTATVTGTLWLAGCSTAGPAHDRHDARLYRLPPQAVQPLPSLPQAEDDPLARPAWRLQRPLGWPAHLDDERLLLPRPQGQWPVPQNDRWAEPLRAAVERLLLADLQDLRGPGRVDSAALPVAGSGRRLPLQIQVLEMDTAPDRRSLRLSARWRLGPSNEGTIIECSRALQVPVSAPTPEAVVLAHRAAIDRLAWAVAATRARGCPDLGTAGV